MDKEKSVQKMTEVMAKFVGYTGKVLPDDVTAKRQTSRRAAARDPLKICAKF